MPIYEYRCDTCGHELEKLQKMSDAPLTDCPACGKAALRKLVSAAGFRLKGSGWYETDFKGKNRRNVAESSDSGKSDTGKSDSGKSDSGKSDSGSAQKSDSGGSKDGKTSGEKKSGGDSSSSSSANKAA